MRSNAQIRPVHVDLGETRDQHHEAAIANEDWVVGGMNMPSLWISVNGRKIFYEGIRGDLRPRFVTAVEDFGVRGCHYLLRYHYYLSDFEKIRMVVVPSWTPYDPLDQ
jgi:hypothetical protein